MKAYAKASLGKFLAVLIAMTWIAPAAAQTPVLVKDLGGVPSHMECLTDVGGLLFFGAQTPTTGPPEPWISDGTEAGTYMVKDIYPGTIHGSSPGFIADLGGIALFQARTLESGEELWRSDGTEAGTYMVRNINPDPLEPGGSVPMYLTVYNGNVYFRASADSGAELYRSDGTYAGTYMVRDIYPGGSSSPANFEVAGGTLFFSASDTSSNAELWKTDGTWAGTVLVRDINASGSSYPEELCALGSWVIFRADDGVRGEELWKSNGTAVGTVRIKDIYPGVYDSRPRNFVVYNGEVYFFATDADGSALWKTDGTPAGTVKIKDPCPTGESMAMNLAVVGDMLYFAAAEVYSLGLWKSDGTTEGTEVVIPYCGGYPHPSRITDFDGMCYFTRDDYTHGDELWRCDGTEASAELVYDFYPGAGDGLQGVRIAGDVLYIYAELTDGHAQLWKIDDLSGVDSEGLDLPGEVRLGPIRPNPSSGMMRISYSLPVSGDVRIDVFDVQGRLVRCLLDSHVSEGTHTIVWDGCDASGSKVSRGIYFCRMRTDSIDKGQKIVLVW